MEATSNCNLNREFVAEKLQVRNEVRKEAIREEAHARFERVMIKTVNEQHAGNARKQESDRAEAAAKEAEKEENVREFKRKRALARAVADGEDYMLQIYVCSGAFIVAALLRSFGIISLATGIALRVLLALHFAYTTYRLYQVSGAIAKLSDGGEPNGK